MKLPPDARLTCRRLLAGAGALAGAAAPARADDAAGVASSRMSYSRFLEYLDMGRVKKVRPLLSSPGHVPALPERLLIRAHARPHTRPTPHTRLRRPLVKVDLYENGTIAIVEAVSPELGNRVQRVRVQLPGTSAELLGKFREKKVDFDVEGAEGAGSDPDAEGAEKEDVPY